MKDKQSAEPIIMKDVSYSKRIVYGDIKRIALEPSDRDTV